MSYLVDGPEWVRDSSHLPGCHSDLALSRETHRGSLSPLPTSRVIPEFSLKENGTLVFCRQNPPKALEMDWISWTHSPKANVPYHMPSPDLEPTGCMLRKTFIYQPSISYVHYRMGSCQGAHLERRIRPSTFSCVHHSNHMLRTTLTQDWGPVRVPDRKDTPTHQPSVMSVTVVTASGLPSSKKRPCQGTYLSKTHLPTNLLVCTL